MQKILRELGKAGVKTLELQARVCVPKADLVQFLSASGWPPYDSKSGMLAFSQIADEGSSYKITLFLQGNEEAAPQSLVIEITPGVADKVDVPPDKMEELIRFLRQDKDGYSVTKLRGVVHTVSDVDKDAPVFPLRFSDNLDLVGIRLVVKDDSPVKSLIENMIFERVGDTIHRRLATKELSEVKERPLADLVLLVLACRKDWAKLMGDKE